MLQNEIMAPNNEDSVIQADETILKQKSRAKLREDFLRAIAELQGESVNILTYELSTLQATFAGWKTDGTEMLVKDMTTPACAKMPSALLRTTDILAIEFKNPVQLP